MNTMRTGYELLTATMHELSRTPGAQTLIIPGGAREIYPADQETWEPSPGDVYVRYEQLLCIAGAENRVWLVSLGTECTSDGRSNGGGSLACISLVPATGTPDDLLVAYAVRELVGKGDDSTPLRYEPSGELVWDGESESFAALALDRLAPFETQPTPETYRYHWDALPLIVDGLKALFAGKTS